MRSLLFKILIVFGVSLSFSMAVANTYTVDSGHSTLVFRAKHLGVAYFYGRFNELSGTLVFDEKDPTKNTVELEINAESVDTANERRDQHLKSPDFFNAKQFPVITFKSKSVKKLDAENYEVSGDFTLHGVTKPLTVKVMHTGSGKDRRGSAKVGFETTFTIKRSDFGMTFMLDGVSDEVRISLGIEANGQ